MILNFEPGAILDRVLARYSLDKIPATSGLGRDMRMAMLDVMNEAMQVYRNQISQCIDETLAAAHKPQEPSPKYEAPEYEHGHDQEDTPPPALAG